MGPSDAYPEQGVRGTSRASTGGLPGLSSEEAAVLEILAGDGGSLTMGAIRARTGLELHQVLPALASLRAKGMVTRLNTVVESYAPRFPGLRVESE